MTKTQTKEITAPVSNSCTSEATNRSVCEERLQEDARGLLTGAVGGSDICRSVDDLKAAAITVTGKPPTSIADSGRLHPGGFLHSLQAAPLMSPLPRAATLCTALAGLSLGF